MLTRSLTEHKPFVEDDIENMFFSQRFDTGLLTKDETSQTNLQISYCLFPYAHAYLQIIFLFPKQVHK